MDATQDWPQEYVQFFRLFNRREFFEAHEVLEDLWSVEVPPLKQYYKGLIQMAVAICHWERGNSSGARKLYRSASAYLAPYPDHFEGFDLGTFRGEMAAAFAPLLAAETTAAPAIPPPPANLREQVLAPPEAA